MLDDKTYQELKHKHGRIAEAETLDGRDLAIKKPDADSFRAYIVKLTKDNTNKEAAMRDLVRECAVYPRKEDGATDHDAVDSILNDFPGFPLAFAAAINEMSGASVEVRVRKN